MRVQFLNLYLSDHNIVKFSGKQHEVRIFPAPPYPPQLICGRNVSCTILSLPVCLLGPFQAPFLILFIGLIILGTIFSEGWTKSAFGSFTHNHPTVILMLRTYAIWERKRLMRIFLFFLAAVRLSLPFIVEKKSDRSSVDHRPRSHSDRHRDPLSELYVDGLSAS